MNWLHILIITSVFYFYRPALKYHYTVDDLGSFIATERGEHPKPKSKLKQFWYKWVGKAYWDNVDPAVHLMPIIVHWVACLCVYFIAANNTIGLIAALLFAVHPSITEVTVGLSSKAYATTSILAMVAWLVPVTAPALFIFTPHWFYYINGIFSPLIFLLRDDWWTLCAVCIVFTLWRFYRMAFAQPGEAPGKIEGVVTNPRLLAVRDNPYAFHIHPRKIIIMLKFYGFILVNQSLGLHYAFWHSYMEDFQDTKAGIKKSTKIDQYLIVGIVAMCIVIGGFIHLRHELWYFGLFWFTIHTLMWCNFISTGQQHMASRYYYIGTVGIVIMIAALIYQYPFITGAWLFWYLRQFLYSMRQWKDGTWQFLYQVVDHPDFYYSWLNLGNMHFSRGQFHAAQSAYITANIYRPNHFKVLFNLSSVFVAQSDILKAVGALEKARKSDFFAQEETANKLIEGRMRLINDIIIAAKKDEKIKLGIEDIPIVS